MTRLRTESYKLSNLWREMWARCTDVKHPKYKDYGGRGITVCKRWESFAAFERDMGLRPDKTMSLERIKNNRGYSPKNCRWATAAEQARNKRNNIWVTYQGRTLILTDWANVLGINKGTLRHRIVVLKLPTHLAFKPVSREFNNQLRGF